MKKTSKNMKTANVTQTQPPVEQPPVDVEKLFRSPAVRDLITKNHAQAQLDLRLGPGGAGWSNNEGVRQRYVDLATFWSETNKALEHYGE